MFLLLGSILNAIRPLALILAALAVCVASASMWPNFTGGRATLPAQVAEGAVLQQDCDRDDDVSVTISSQWGVIERTTYTLKDPPDYKAGDDIGIYYDVTNSSCRNVTVTVELKGSVSEATIHNADATDDMACLEGCTINAGDTLNGNVGWDLSNHPNATGEKVVATVTVDAPSDFDDTDTSNNSATSTQAINIVNEEPEPAPDISVESVTPSVTTAVIGETVNFTVSVHNVGDADADVDTTLTLDHGADTTELDSETVSALAVDGESTATLAWNTDGAAAGAHSLRVLAQTEGDGNADNDSATISVTLVEPSVDVAVKSVTASATEAVVGDTVDFTVTLENDGNVAIAPTVSLYQGEATEALGSATASPIAAGGTDTVTISWDTAGEDAGTHSVRAVATVADDDDSSNDSATVSLTLHDPVDVELRLTSPLAASTVKGSAVNVPFTVTNSGANDAGEIMVSLHVSEAGQNQNTPGEATATTTVATLAVAASSSGTLSWDTTDVSISDYQVLLVASTAGDTDRTNNTVKTSMEIRNWLVLQNVVPQNSVAIVGEVVEFIAQVQNVGPEELTDLTVGLFEPDVEDALGSTTIASIAVGTAGTATIEWETSGRDVAALDLIVAAGADGQDPDRDDSQFVSLDLRNPIALSSAMPASTDNVAGSAVTINVQVRNESEAEVSDISVALYVGDSAATSGTATIDSIAAGETADAGVVWDAADTEPGEHQLKIVVSSPDYDADSDDVAPLTLDLRAPVMAVALSGATINRNVATIGQTLEVVATITNHGEVPVEAPVGLYQVTRLHENTAVATTRSTSIDPGASAEVLLQWDTTGADVGTHTVKTVVELPDDTTAADNEELLEVELFRSAFDGAHDVDSCVEDVGVKVIEIRDLSDQERSPPNFYVGELLRAAYNVYNFSCDTDLTLILTMSGPDHHPISDASALCFSDCEVPYGGKAEGEVTWTIPTLPALSDQAITAAVTIVSPGVFVDVDEANNSNASADQINIVHPDDVLLRLGEQTDNKTSAGQTLTGPDFGTVDMRLVSVSPLQTTLPFAADTVEFVIEAANDGPTTEPVSVRFVLGPDDGVSPRELHRHTMVIPTGQTRTETVEVPVQDVLPGIHTIEVLLSAAIDQSPENDAVAVEITRLGPMIEVEMVDVSVSPDALVLGDDATVSLTVQNKSEVSLLLTLGMYLGGESQPVVTETLDELAPGDQSPEQIAWRVPDSAKMLGNHALKLVASAADFGAVATVSSEVAFHIDAEIVGIDSLPAETAMQGEAVAIEVAVRNNGPATVNVPITLQFPSETKQPETRHPAVPAGSTEIAHFTWKTRDYAVGDYKLTANVPEHHNISGGETSTELPFQLSPLTITATIGDVTPYPETPSVGEPVLIKVTVRNDGPVATRIPITLHFPPGGRQPETKRPHVAPGRTGTATFDWLTGNYAAGTYQFLIEVAAVNSPQRRFTVDLLPVVENVAIVGMGTYPRETAMVGEPVDIWVDVHNDGPVALNVPVRLTFPSASKRPETPSPRLEPGETKRVFFEWKTSNYEPGFHTLRAAILLDNNIAVGPTSEELRFRLTPLVILATILDVTVSPEEPRVGEPVTITVTVRNDGRIAANIPVTLHFPSADKQPATRRPRVAPGAVGTTSFTWRTGRYQPGTHTFVVEVGGTPPLAHEFTVELLPPIVDVAIVGMGSDPSGTAVQGQAVTVWVDVVNNGPSALNVPVQLSFPSGDKQPERKSTRIEASETARVEFTWRTANCDPGDHNLTAKLLVNYNVTEFDISATIQIRLVPAHLIASIAGISWTPEAPVVGEPVHITVTVRNDGFVATNIPVTLHFPSGDKQPETRRPRIAPAAVGTASFTWRTSRYEPGDHVFRVQIPGTAGAVREFEIELSPPAVDFAVVDFQAPNPLQPIVKGDWVEMTVVIHNRGPYAGRGTVNLLNAADLGTMYAESASLEPGEFRDVEFTWKTLRYPVGGYELMVRVDAEHDTDPSNNETDRARVHLLTDRDITVGFDHDVHPAVFAVPRSEANPASVPRYRNEIFVSAVSQTPTNRPTAPAAHSPLGVVPRPMRGNYDPTRMYWRWRSAQTSPWECARYQQETGESLPRVVACPRAPALVR